MGGVYGRGQPVSGGEWRGGKWEGGTLSLPEAGLMGGG